MAYGLNTAQLASTIEGESSFGRGGAAGQFAVAAVMQNRLNAGYSPSSLLSVNQFEANNHYTLPSANAVEMANAVNNGTVGNYGDTGNALFYNGRGGPDYTAYNSVPGANIGGNAYSNVYQGPGNSSFAPPQYGGTAQADAASDAAQDSGAGNSDAAYGVGPGSYADNGAGGIAGSGMSYSDSYGAGLAPQGGIGSAPSDTPLFAQGGSAAGTQGYDPNAGVTAGGQGFGLSGAQSGSGGAVAPDGYTGNSADATPNNFNAQDIPNGVSAAGGGSSAPAIQQQQQAIQTAQSAASSDASAASSATAGASDAGGGLPVVITDVTAAGSQAGAAIASGAQSAGQSVSQGVQQGASTVGSAIGSFGQTLTALVNSGLTGGTDIFVRAALVGLALVLLFGAFYLFGNREEGKTTIVPVPV